jgi:hypothetical protein
MGQPWCKGNPKHHMQMDKCVVFYIPSMMTIMDLPSSKFAKVATLGIQTYNDKYVPHIGCIILHLCPRVG